MATLDSFDITYKSFVNCNNKCFVNIYLYLVLLQECVLFRSVPVSEPSISVTQQNPVNADGSGGLVFLFLLIAVGRLLISRNVDVF